MVGYCRHTTIENLGTTGTPKVITVSKQAMVHSALATAEYFNLHSGNTALLCLPARYVAGKMMLVRSLIIGLELDIIPAISSLDALLPEKKIRFCSFSTLTSPT